MLPVVVSDHLSHTWNEVARAFLIEMQECVRAVDYARARPLLADDVVAFGTFAAVVEAVTDWSTNSGATCGRIFATSPSG
jgi:hypothetical protein